MKFKLQVLILGLGVTTTGCMAFPELEEAVIFDRSQAKFKEFLSVDALQDITADMDLRQQDNYSAKLKNLRNRADDLRVQDLSDS